ncbi:hypothetical protein [Microlunatus sp. Y2014]|uniref:hypothetical protein n=1 Tax=Microlunatus sp. Y2014 TaxID=3418488 RepID=UPI003DA76C4D
MTDRVDRSVTVPTTAPSSGDPGMAIKMGPKSFQGTLALLRGEAIDERAIEPLLAFVEQRLDCADFRVVVLLKVLYADPPGLSPRMRDRIAAAVLDFRYWMDEPGSDGMCHWSENHQILFGVAEHLAGALLPDVRFGNNGMTGAERRDRSRRRIDHWLAQRFRHGFTEWLSNTYYEEDVAALALLIDHAAEPELVTRATMIMDLLLLDMALHRFDGRFVGSAGRCYEQQKKDPSTADVNQILAHAFGPDGPIDEESLSVLFRTSSYDVPSMITSLAAAAETMIINTSTGLDLDEVATEFADDPDDVDTAGLTYWLMEAFTTPESIDLTSRMVTEWRMGGNAFLAPLVPLARFRRTGLLPTVVRALNPATQGVAIQRADVTTVRTPHWLASCAQRHQPGGFGDQQHIWQVTLPGDVTIFATHPTAPMFDDVSRNFSPSAWVGNGINPDAVLRGDVLLARYDLRVRPGLLERRRQWLTHLFWPAARMDETITGERRLAGRVGDSFVGVVGLSQLAPGGPDEVVQRGAITGWAVVCGDTGGYADLAAFDAELRRYVLTDDGRELTLTRPGVSTSSTGGGGSTGEMPPPARSYQLARGGEYRVNGEALSTAHPRLACPAGTIERRPSRIVLAYGGHELIMDWTTGTRETR